MLRKNAKVELLKRVPLFAGCSKRELDEIAAIADEFNLDADRNLTREGATGHEFLVLVEGSADVTRRGKKVNTLRSGDFLGEIALITGAPRTATVTTKKPSRMLVVTARDFRSLLRRVPSIQLKVLEALASRLPAEYD
ncbi:MAG TPA: cyclic nucleotide-binding domain-containing protein [Gaiellaceae bacterium]|jgi:CRP-like cAMP-binding protein|nr:cyclic nucleotide-binding domain-containing protein [Gaiellaceae bacterium]